MGAVHASGKILTALESLSRRMDQRTTRVEIEAQGSNFQGRHQVRDNKQNK